MSELETIKKDVDGQLGDSENIIKQIGNRRFEQFYKVSKEVSKASLFLETVVEKIVEDLDQKKQKVIQGTDEANNEAVKVKDCHMRDSCNLFRSYRRQHRDVSDKFTRSIETWRI